MAQGYLDRRKAADGRHTAIWGSWLVLGALWTLLTIWAHGGPLQGVTQWGWFIGGGISTVACVVLSAQVEVADQHFRRAALDDEGAEEQQLRDRLAQQEDRNRAMERELETRMRELGYDEEHVRDVLDGKRDV